MRSETDPVAAYLARCRTLCPELLPADLAVLQSGLAVRTLPAKAEWIAAYSVPPHLGMIVRGLMKAVYGDEEGRRINVNFFSEGMTAGHYQAFVQQTPARYAFQTIEPTTLVLMSRRHFDHCCHTAPHLERLFRLSLEQAFFAYLQRTEMLLCADAERRYLDFVRRQPQLFLRLSLSDLSSYLGIERQSLMRIRKKLAGRNGG